MPPGPAPRSRSARRASRSRRSARRRCRATRAPVRLSRFSSAAPAQLRGGSRRRPCLKTSAEASVLVQPPVEMPPASAPAAQTPSAARAPRRREAAERRRDPGDDLDDRLALPPLDGGARRAGRLDHLADSPLAHRSPSAASGTTNHARPRGWRAIHCATSISDHVRGSYSSPRSFVDARRTRAYDCASGREPVRADRGRRRRHRPAPELVQPVRQARAAPRARAAGRRPCSRGSRAGRARPPPDVTCARTSPRSPWKPPVARITGAPAGRAAAPRGARSPARARASRSARPGRSGAPVVSGLPVSRASDRRAERLEPGERLVEPLPDEPLQPGSPPGHSARKRSHSR